MYLAEILQRRVIIENCVIAIQDWCASRRLPLNPDNTEVIWFGSKSNMAKLRKEEISLILESDVINPSETRRDLGVILDSELTMSPHIARTASTYLYHLRRLRHQRRLAHQPTMLQLNFCACYY